jgi:ParB family chromosome partitioning protein
LAEEEINILIGEQMKKRGLGRNLDVFLSRTSTVASNPIATTATNTAVAETPVSTNIDNELKHLPIEILQRGRYQPRREFAQEQLQELANSIRTQGIIQPLVVRKISADRYEIIAGERRWRAAQLAGLTEVPAIIKDIPDEAALAVALIENIQRENLNPLEEAIALQRLIDEFSLTQQEVAEAVGKSRTTVTNLLRLLTLQPDVKTLLEHGDIEMGHARALLALNDIAQSQAAKMIVAKGLSVRETEELVRTWNTKKSTAKSSPTEPSADIRHLQKNLSDKLGAQVMLQHSAKGKGKLIIRYNSLDELDGILTHIK